MSRVKPVAFDQLYLLNCTRLTETSNTNIVDTDSWVKPAVGDRRLLTHFRWTIQKALTRAFSYERMSQFGPGVYCLGLFGCYSTLGGKTGKLDEAVNKELNVTRS